MYAVPFRIDQNLIKRSPDTHTASQLSLREVQRRSNLWIHLKRRDRHLPAGRQAPPSVSRDDKYFFPYENVWGPPLSLAA